MHVFACFNEQIARVSSVNLPAVSPAAFYGRGVFTTLRIDNSKPFQWDRHWRRLTADARTVGTDLSEFTEENIKNSLAELIRRNRFQSGRARLTFFSESAGSNIWQIEDPARRRRTNLLITSADLRRPSPPSGELRLTISPFSVNSRSPLAGVKSCNYLENLLALEKALAGGFNEAIRLNEKNEIVSATMANVFWTKNGEIFTPPIETGALRGTTRAFVLENFPVCEKLARLDELFEADGIFLTSAGIGAARAQSLEKRIFEEREVFSQIRAAFDKLLLEQ